MYIYVALTVRYNIIIRYIITYTYQYHHHYQYHTPIPPLPSFHIIKGKQEYELFVLSK